MSPLFSIITVTYNASDTIGKTLASVAAQTFDDYEHLIIDGASKDDTIRIVTDNSRPEKTKIVSEPDKGLYDAMNKGMDMASGEYLLFLNSGDTLHSPDTLSHIANAIGENNTPGIVYGQTDIVNSEGTKVADRHLIAPPTLTYESFAEGMVVCHQAFVVLARIASPYNLSYRYSADYEWCIRCLQHSRKNVYIDEPIADYLMEGLTTANRRKSLLERFRIMSKYYGTAPTVIRHLRFARRFLKRMRLERDIPSDNIQNQ
ncbi:MAG: glycosyltransferase [Paramuribaculum sp.]|nr:glycosyltransferase [Paramuribaculum sp.]